MKIKEGYNSQEMEIRINGQSNGSIELWIKMFGMPKEETLSYMTLQELADLKKEVELALKDALNL